MSETADRLDARKLLGPLRRRLWIIVLCCVVVPGSALAFSLSQETKYTAQASLLFRDPGFDQALFGTPGPRQSGDVERTLATNLRLVSLGSVADGAARRIGRGLTGGEVVKKIDVTEEGGSDLVGVEATDADPVLAMRLANAFAEEYIRFRRNADRSQIRQAEAVIRRQIDALPLSQRDSQRARSLEDQQQQLSTLANLQTGNAELVQRARVPTDPSSPKPMRAGLLGGVIGLLLGVSLALILDRFDRRVRSPEEIEGAFDRPILALIPESRAIATGGVDSTPLPPGEAEAFRLLRATLRYFNVKEELRSVLITSAAPGDGKSTVGWNLASAAAEAGERVLLIEADLRHPRFAKDRGLPTGPGLSQVLVGVAPPGEAVRQVAIPAAQEGQAASGRTMDVLGAGAIPPNPSDLIESERMQALIRTAERDYDLTVVDTPPTTVVADAIPLMKEVSGVIVVARLGQSMRDALTQLQTQLQTFDVPVLGVVVNGMSREVAGYGYEYGYGYGYGDGKSDGRSRRSKK